MSRGPSGIGPVGLLLLTPFLLPGCRPQTPPPPEESRPPGPSAGPVLFTDATREAGLDFIHDNGARGEKYLPEIMGSGACALDVDGDGRVDLYLVQSGPVPGIPGEIARPTNRLFRNLGDGRFTDVTLGSGAGDAGYGMGCVTADYDGDGDTDLYVLNLGPNVLLRNEGGGRFTDVTAEAGVGDPAWGSSAAFLDGDADGDLDLYVANYLDWTVDRHIDCGDLARDMPSYCHPDVYPMAPDVYYRNEGDGRFVEATREAGLLDPSGKGMGVAAGDLDRDGRTDLYVANDSTPNFYYRNRGAEGFQEMGLPTGTGWGEGGETQAGMGVALGDTDGDGRIDIFVTNLSRETNALYLARGFGYVHATREAGLHRPSYLWTGFGTDLLDLDNDGDLDLFVTNGHVIDNIELYDDVLRFEQPSQAFWNDGKGRFAQVPAETAGDISRPRVGRGSVTLDYDDDGRLDQLVVFNGDRARLFRNTWPAAGSWIRVRLVGPPGNRDGLGARVVLETGGRTQVQERRAGESYQSSHDPRLHFGLGSAGRVERIHVEWPDGVVGTWSDLEAGRTHVLEWAPPDRES